MEDLLRKTFMLLDEMAKVSLLGRRPYLTDAVRALIYDLDAQGKTVTIYDFVKWTGRDPGTVRKIFRTLEKREHVIERMPWSVSKRAARPCIPYRIRLWRPSQ